MAIPIICPWDFPPGLIILKLIIMEWPLLVILRVDEILLSSLHMQVRKLQQALQVNKHMNTEGEQEREIKSPRKARGWEYVLYPLPLLKTKGKHCQGRSVNYWPVGVRSRRHRPMDHSASWTGLFRYFASTQARLGFMTCHRKVLFEVYIQA